MISTSASQRCCDLHSRAAAPAREVRMSLSPAGARPSRRPELDESTAGGTPEKAMDDGGGANKQRERRNSPDGETFVGERKEAYATLDFCVTR
ncbi:hypothetical protein C2845_PM06G26010 [Panicum miliaceum]|uniref:Uncharacterized protein n=1 Tax=Panicum miliaceum TaxID=4540 RepID=A0A3L6R6Y1_PANMI|nr:hypothetical protein C2845_PM06G26010 [Panicum miliaceum]